MVSAHVGFTQCLLRIVGHQELRHPAERRLGTNDPTLLPDRREMSQEGAPFREVRERAVEGEPSGLVARDQPGRARRRNSAPGTRTGSRNAGRDDLQRSPS